VLRIVVDQVGVKVAAHRGLHDWSFGSPVQGHDHALVHVMAGTNVIGDAVKATRSEVLGPDNEAGEKVVEADKDAAQDNGRTRRLDQTDEQLAHVTVNGKVEGEKGLRKME
jgi:hypothetical protein